MKIIVFGPTGMIGSRIVAELERRDHEVIGASRASGVDVTDAGAVARIASGADAVVSAVSARGVDDTLAGVARSLVDGLRRAGVRRLLIVGGAGRWRRSTRSASDSKAGAGESRGPCYQSCATSRRP